LRQKRSVTLKIRRVAASAWHFIGGHIPIGPDEAPRRTSTDTRARSPSRTALARWCALLCSARRVRQARSRAGKTQRSGGDRKAKNIRSVYPPSVDAQLVTGCRGTIWITPARRTPPLRQKCCSDRKELVRRQRQVADTLSSSIEHSIGDGGGDSGNADFADAARAHG
jgi:hypothetical protein